MKYVIRLRIGSSKQKFPLVEQILRQHGYDLSHEETYDPGVPFDPSDPLRERIQQELTQLGDNVAFAVHHNVEFEPEEVERAELLHVLIRAECGKGFGQIAKEYGLPPGTLTMDKEAMGKKHIAMTHAFEIVISEGLKAILEEEILSGWRTEPVRHLRYALGKDSYPPLFHLTSTNELPPLAPETILHVEKYLPKEQFLGTEALAQRGPFLYQRARLKTIEDFNRTHEQFGPTPMKHARLIISQRAWHALRKHKIEYVDVEPVGIL